MDAKKFDLQLRPIHYACVSGGKDSLYMLYYILQHLNKYPLDCVVHYELEIDWPWTVEVIDYMESECKKHNIPFYRIKPRRSWKELYDKYNFPTGRVRWCNSEYKLDAEMQMINWIKSMNCRPVAYIGFCADESKRFKYQIGEWKTQHICYPLAEEGIEENTILEWAKDIPLFNNWYKHFKRQGCMMCPMLTRKELAYMLKYYPEEYKRYINYTYIYEDKFKKNYFDDYNTEYVDKIIRSKWLPKLELEEIQSKTSIKKLF